MRLLHNTLPLLLIISEITCTLTHNATNDDMLSTSAILEAYRHIYVVKGNPVLLDGGMPVSYITDRIRILLNVKPNTQVNLTNVRTMSQVELSKILLYAVAGTYVTGKGTMSPDACHITADPTTGVLQVSRDKPDSDVVLTAVCLILVTALAAVIYKDDKQKN